MAFIAPLIGIAVGGFLATALGQAVISIGLSIGAAYLARRLAPKPSNTNQGQSLSLRLEANESREVCFGRVRQRAISTTGAHIVRSDNAHPARPRHLSLIKALKLEWSSQSQCLEASIRFMSTPRDSLDQIVAPYRSLSRECNVSSYIDRVVLGRHVGSETHDPEGLLTTVPAFATTLSGMAAGQWLRAMRCDHDKLLVLVAGGACCMATGLVGDLWFPINKNLWTGSYVVLTAGISALVLAACYAFVRNKKLKGVLPFRVLGVNALAVYTLSELLARVITTERWWNLPHADGRQGADLRAFLYEQLFMLRAVPKIASALWALAYLGLIIWLMTVVCRLRVRITRFGSPTSR